LTTVEGPPIESVVAALPERGEPWHCITRVMVMCPGDALPRPALEYGYDGWECPDCGDDLGSCAGRRAVRLHQQCGCGASVVGLM
jgi:hypothetical protein